MPDDMPPTILLVDDDELVLSMVSEALAQHGMRVLSYLNGAKALEFLEESGGQDVDLVLSDINMQGMDGFDVIHRVKYINPNLPVVLMTGEASLEYAMRAMRMGAANLFQKPVAIRDMVGSVFHLVSIHRDLRKAEVGLRGLVSEDRHFCFRSDEIDIPSMVAHLTDRLVPLGFAKPTNVDVIAMAYHEALVNALEHGNLEMDSSLKGDIMEDSDAYTRLLSERLADPNYASRRVQVRMHITPDACDVVILDDGHGFDCAKLPRITDDSLMRQCGRGLAMIHMVMDEVSHNDVGNEIRLGLTKKSQEKA